MHQRHLPAAYRVHEKPNDDKLAIVRQAAASFGYHHPLPERPNAGQVARFVRALANEPRGKTLLPLVLRAMSRARYSAERLGHFALAEPDYLHFTSPIRRFPDLLVHRSLGSSGGDAPADIARACALLSEREQASERVERDVDDYYRCLLAEPLVGEEFDATVTGAAEFGVFVQMAEPYVEGLVPVRTMGDDYYSLDEVGLRLFGRRTGRSIGVGDVVRVRITEVRRQRRQIEFEWIAKAKKTGDGGDTPRGDFLARAREKFAAGTIGSKPAEERGFERSPRGRPDKAGDGDKRGGPGRPPHPGGKPGKPGNGGGRKFRR
jgi:ribonuclease R